MEKSTIDMKEYVVSRLDEAIDQGWIRPYYQPVVRTVSGKLCGMEALARWEDPHHGLLPPLDFIGPLEDAQLIHKLDSCIVNQVCEQLRDNLLGGKPVVPVSLNLSRLDFDLCDIHEVIEQAVRSNEIPRSHVNIEITESVFGSDPAFMASVIERFHDNGYQVWMDDFGSAYSSLNVLKDFEFEEMKIDMAFLSRLGEKSRIILASVVDMAKRLGIQTLAEGVETPEHAEFLRHIGCEKQQGYFYGKPSPYSDELLSHFGSELGIEHQNERYYYRTIGSVNTLSLSEQDFIPENKTIDYVTSMPLAFVEYDGLDFTILDCNEPFSLSLANMGIPSVADAERLLNDPNRVLARRARRLMGVIELSRFARQDYNIGRYNCIVRAKYIATRGSRIAVLVSIAGAGDFEEQRRRSRIEEAKEVLYSIYEHVDVLHLDDSYSEPISSQASFKHVYEIPTLKEAVHQFAEHEIFVNDRKRYLEFMNPETMIQRIDEGNQGFLVGFFRARDRGGDYIWKMFSLIRMPEEEGASVLVCIRDADLRNDKALQWAYDGYSSDDSESKTQPVQGPAVGDTNPHISDSDLWYAMLRDPQFGIFWKDAERRFLGCNQKFLDYYGFESVDDIIGKTDEDMGWHVDNVPYQSDEYRVLNEGIQIANAHGRCIVRGDLRDIVASKWPVYNNGRIVGLLGYFIDVTDTGGLSNEFGMMSYIDSVTDTLNYGGLDAATCRYIESYERTGGSFAMIMMDIDNFKYYNQQYGYAFGDKVLHCVGQTIMQMVGATCVLGHLYAARFVVLKRSASQDEMNRLGEQIVSALSGISQVDGVAVTLYAHFSVVDYSEVNSLDEFKRLGRSRLHKVQDLALGKMKGEDTQGKHLRKDEQSEL